MWPRNPAPNDLTLPDIKLEATRLYMRPPQPADWGQWADVRGANQRRLKPFEPHWAPDSLSGDFFKRRLARQAKDWEQDRAHAFLIFRSSDDQLIGGMNVNHICRGAAQFASLGYWIAQEVEGQGYMREAMSRIFDYCFHDMKLHRLNASCLVHNERSKGLLRRLGFAEEGLARHYLKIDGQWQDHVLFGLSVEDFQQNRTTRGHVV